MSQSILDDSRVVADIKHWISQGDTNTTIARRVGEHWGIGTSPDAIRRFRKRHGINPAGVEPAYTKIDGREAEAALAPTIKPILDDPDSMLKQRGLDPEEWAIKHITANEYQGPASSDYQEKTGETKVTYYQTKFTAEKRKFEVEIVLPRTDGWKAPPKAKIDRSQPRLVVIVGDQQAPFHDPHLHQCFLRWLEANEPSEGISLGDSVDFPDISRHQLDPENTASVNECLQAGYDLFRGYVEASPNTHWKKIPGNHDERLRNLFLSKPRTHAAYDIRRPKTSEGGGEQVHSPAYLLRLDELGIEYIDPHGQYDMAQIDLSPKLAVRHGWIARKDSGASAVETLKHTGFSVIIGHAHRQSIVHKTIYNINDYPKVLTAVEAGCMCRLDTEVNKTDDRRFPNYTALPDWQQGWCAVWIWPDGRFKIDLATYVNETLLYQDQRYR